MAIDGLAFYNSDAVNINIILILIQCVWFIFYSIKKIYIYFFIKNAGAS